MTTFALVLLLSGGLPLGFALFVKRRTVLVHALLWSSASWICWLAFVVSSVAPLRYFALCLTGCAAVAVLGARRPHAAAWNFVVLGLLAVMLLPFIEAWLLGSETFDTLRVVLLYGTILMGVVNYLPTRFAAAALALACGCGGQLIVFRIPAAELHALDLVSSICLGLTPWLAFVSRWPRRRPVSALQASWLQFRDSFGLFWALRVREQFNRAAANMGSPVRLAWNGVRSDSGDAALTATLEAILQRFR